MKPHTFLLLFVSVLSCRAQNSAAPGAASPVTQAPVPAKPAQAPTAAKPAEVASPAPAPEAAKATAPAKAEMQPTMGAFVVSGASDLKPSAPDLGTSLADMRAEQKASMKQQLVDDAQSRKAAFAGVLTIQQPTLSPPKLTNSAAPAATLVAPAIDAKNRTADLFNTK